MLYVYLCVDCICMYVHIRCKQYKGKQCLQALTIHTLIEGWNFKLTVNGTRDRKFIMLAVKPWTTRKVVCGSLVERRTLMRSVENDWCSIMYGWTTQWTQCERGWAGGAGVKVGTGHEDSCHWSIQAHTAHHHLPGLLQSSLQLPLLCFQDCQVWLSRLHC